MALMCKTPAGTLCAITWKESPELDENYFGGITFGIYGVQAVASFEYQNGHLSLLINDDVADASNIEIVHTDKDWNKKE